MIELNEKTMREAKRSLQESGIKSEDVKPIPPPIVIEVHSLQRFDDRDIPYYKPPAQSFD